MNNENYISSRTWQKSIKRINATKNNEKKIS